MRHSTTDVLSFTVW